MNRLTTFLARNSVVPTGPLPAVHSTAAYHLQDFWTSNKIIPQECDVFPNNDLIYFFIGRPAYKLPSDPVQAENWELPCCFIFDFATIGRPKRIFPFDSGGFSKVNFPHFIRMMKLDEFDVSELDDSPQRIIGAYFGDLRNYFQLRPKGGLEFDQQFNLSAFDHEVKAVHRLAVMDKSTSIDDRRLCIECQYVDVIDMTVNRPLAVVAPLPYFEDDAFRKHVVQTWNAAPLPYGIGPLQTSNYYGQIYAQVEKFYRRRKYI